jgi:hypothetical protein
VLSPAQLQRFRSVGFLVVDGLWPEALVQAAGAEIEELLPPRTSASAVPGIPGSDGLVVLPSTAKGEASPEMAVNALPVCPRVLCVVAQLLETSQNQVRLSQCHVSIKHGRPNEAHDDRRGSLQLAGDQDHHLDFWDNMLLAPDRSPPPGVAALCYYSRVEECAGATHLAPTPCSAADAMTSMSAAVTPTTTLRAEAIPAPGDERNAWIFRNIDSFQPCWHRVGALWVAHDYFKIQGVRIPCAAAMSVAIAAHFGGRLPSGPEEVDTIWRAAELKLPPLPWGPPYDDSMCSAERLIEHSARIDAQLQPWGQQKLIAGHKKDVIPSMDPSKVCIYGWHYTNGSPIQPVNDHSHDASYADYSHGVRIVRDTPPAESNHQSNRGDHDGTPTPVVEDGAARVPHESGWVRDSAFMDSVYATERPVRFKQGTTVLYLLDTWHRGTPVALGSWRYSQHTVWKRADASFVGYQALPPNLASMPPRYIASLSPTQRPVLGIPAPGHRYWTKTTVQAAALRYGIGFDTEPYLKHLVAGGSRL